MSNVSMFNSGTSGGVGSSSDLLDLTILLSVLDPGTQFYPWHLSGSVKWIDKHQIYPLFFSIASAVSGTAGPSNASGGMSGSLDVLAAPWAAPPTPRGPITVRQ